MVNDISLWILIGVGGVIGGLLYGIRDKELTLPHWEGKHAWNPGFLADLLFGLAGGFVIFIIIPGTFDYRQGGWAMIQILALAGVGGYGGRALVEKYVNDQVQALEKDVHRLENQSRLDAIVIKLLDQHLDDDPDTPLIPKEKLQSAIASASSTAKVQVFDKTREFRLACMAEGKRHLLPQAIPVFECLIELDKDQKYHRNYAQLGFILKDMLKPDWKRAEECFNKAIAIRQRQKEVGYIGYEFNRALCRIELGSGINEIKADLEAALHGEKTADWVRHPNLKLAPELLQWLCDHYVELRDWIQANQIVIPAEG